MATKRPYPGNMFCPCHSGRKYKACCQPNEIQYFIGPKGKITKVMPLVGADKAVYEEELLRFVEATGRIPTEQEDKVLRAANFEDVEKVIANEMLSAGTRPELIYAFEKTGLLVTRENEHLITPEELRRWDAAIEEYRLNQALTDTDS